MVSTGTDKPCLTTPVVCQVEEAIVEVGITYGVSWWRWHPNTAIPASKLLLSVAGKNILHGRHRSKMYGHKGACTLTFCFDSSQCASACSCAFWGQKASLLTTSAILV